MQDRDTRVTALRPLRLAALACLGLAVSCSAPAGEQPAREATEQFARLITSGQKADACRLLAPRVQDALAMRHSGSCAAGVSGLPLQPAMVSAVAVWGDEAQARTAHSVVFLHEFSSGWRITGAGCHPRNEQVYDCAIGGP